MNFKVLIEVISIIDIKFNIDPVTSIGFFLALLMAFCC